MGDDLTDDEIMKQITDLIRDYAKRTESYATELTNGGDGTKTMAEIDRLDNDQLRSLLKMRLGADARECLATIKRNQDKKTIDYFKRLEGGDGPVIH